MLLLLLLPLLFLARSTTFVYVVSACRHLLAAADNLSMPAAAPKEQAAAVLLCQQLPSSIGSFPSLPTSQFGKRLVVKQHFLAVASAPFKSDSALEELYLER